MVAVERIITHGTFELDGGSWEVDNNTGLVGAAPILAAVNGPMRSR
jgi:hypothetical protein